MVFTSDNGFFHGEHRVQVGKVLVYEPSIRVPLILRGPGCRGTSAAASWSPTPTSPPRSSTPPERGRAAPRTGARCSGCWAIRAASGAATCWSRAAACRAAGEFDALRTYRYLYAKYSTGESELYDLDRDPYELQSRHADARLRGRAQGGSPAGCRA